MKSKFRKGLFALAVIFAVVAFQNCGVVSISKMSPAEVSSKACDDFAASKPEHIYEDASNQANLALFKMNELTSNGSLITSQRIFDWAVDGNPRGSSRDLTLNLDSLNDCQVYEVTATIQACNELLTWKKSYMKAGASCPTTTTVTTTTVPSPSTTDARGCTDDNSVPIVREINFATTPGWTPAPYPLDPADLNWHHVWDRVMRNPVSQTVHNAYCTAHPEQPYPSQWPAYYMPPACEDIPSVVAVKLIVVNGGGNWYDGSLEIGPSRGTSTAEGVISRCRGSFGPGGREHVIHLDGYTGSGNQSPITFFANWLVDATNPNVYTANLLSPGKRASDGWLSDGVYYINVRQTWCNGTSDQPGVCWRTFVGQGVSKEVSSGN